ncbi:MAG: peptide chain release factor N(5)-glutamine methyltransferase [Acidobacteriota bacterium]
MTTVHERVAAARQMLGAAGIGALEAASSARVLAQHVLGWDTTRLLTSGHEPEPGGFGERYDALVARRAAREPSAYITGRREFWGLTLEVSPAVLIPRPETELIVEAALEIFAVDPPRRLDIADACTGCGNLAVALAHELGQASIVATDISADALAVAQRNAERHGVSARIRFVHADVLEGVNGPFDLIVANPPYVKREDRPALQPEVRDHEPGVALFGGVTGTELVATVVEQGVARLRPGGYLMFEFGFGQEIVAETLIAATQGLTLIGLRRDLQGLARMAIARRQGDTP